MANGTIPPAPIRDPWGSYSWEDWFRQLRNRAAASLTSVSWSGIDFTGSSLTSLLDRKHNDLTNIQGGTSAEYYHLTQTQHTDLTDGGASTLHYHTSDRDSANFTGTNWTDLTDSGDSSLHYHSSDRNSDNFSGTEWTKLETLVSQTIGATPSASAATTTHKVPITLNGTTYYILLSDV